MALFLLLIIWLHLALFAARRVGIISRLVHTARTCCGTQSSNKQTHGKIRTALVGGQYFGLGLYACVKTLA